MKARDYQEECCERILAAIAQGAKAILAVLFTGAGKTVVFSLLARMCSNSKVLVIAPLRELVWQCADTADRVTGEYTEVEMANQWAGSYGGRVVVACVKSLLAGKEKRYKRFLGYRLIIVDEAHTQFSEAVLAMLRDFQAHGGIVIGFTATPFRMDGRRLMDFYETVAFEYDLKRGIEEGWCLSPRAKVVRVDGLDTKNVKVTGGDLSAGDLDLVLGAARPLHQMCLIVQKERVGAALAFLPGVRTAMSLAELAQNAYGMRAAYIVGDTRIQSDDERNLVINRYRNGEIDLLCNCQIATMGFDAPVTRTVFMFRPTRSRVLFKQVIGRATRPAPGDVDGRDELSAPGMEGVAARLLSIASGDKPWFKIVDITGTTEDHSIVTAVDMFAKDDEDKEVVIRARKRAEEGDAEDPGDLLAQAADDVRKAKLLEESLRGMTGQATGTLHGHDVELVGKKKCISEYRCPLRGRNAGRRMGELDDGYIDWALRQTNIKGWQKSFFHREKARRRSLAGHGR
jgi:superfamily II DNA or RNA helicase